MLPPWVIDHNTASLYELGFDESMMPSHLKLTAAETAKIDCLREWAASEMARREALPPPPPQALSSLQSPPLGVCQARLSSGPTPGPVATTTRHARGAEGTGIGPGEAAGAASVQPLLRT